MHTWNQRHQTGVQLFEIKKEQYALGYGWSVKGEYLYVKFDDFTTFTTGPFAPVNASPREVRLEDHIFRAGMNYKFW